MLPISITIKKEIYSLYLRQLLMFNLKVLLTGIISFSCLYPFSQNQKGAAICSHEHKYDLGEINPLKYLIKFVYHTSGDRPLVITKVMVSCSCASPVWSKEPLQLGVRYTSSGYFDPHNKAASCIFVFSNADEKPEIIRIEAIISHK